MVCVICPTATAAAVITGELGGSASTLTTYTLLSNLLAAVGGSFGFPLVEPHADMTFFAAFLKILSKVFPLLLFPFLPGVVSESVYAPCEPFLLGFMILLLFVGRSVCYCIRATCSFPGNQ